MKSKSIGEMGRVEVLLLDDASNIVARINMNDLYWDAEITKKLTCELEMPEHLTVYEN